jgi:2C-methyl-D-erythritol 2,4-cyclodiphosphate synthase
MKDRPISLRDIYPHFTDEQLEEAEANLERYLAVMMHIAERLRAEGYDLKAADLTLSAPSPTIHDERSNPPQKKH